MFTPGDLKALHLLSASLLSSHAHAGAQSGRKPPPPATAPGMRPAPAPTPVDYTRYEKVRVLVSRGPDNFVRDLNGQGTPGTAST